MKKISEEQLDEIIDTLQGTCDTLNGAISEILGSDDFTDEDLTPDQIEKLDGEIFLCDDCGWWCEVVNKSDIEGECVCEDCEEIR